VKKHNNKYWFTVEGETEQWYLEWLQKLINDADADFTVTLKADIEKNPFKYVKRPAIISRTVIYHLSDYESDDPIHVKDFNDTMSNLKKAKSAKQIDYRFCYSNLTFDLWIILHKQSCNGSLTHRRNYLEHINRAYSENFESMDDYKHENNFKRLLYSLTLDDVKSAIYRANNIMQTNLDNEYTLHKYKGYEYYKENPSLLVHKAVEKILADCELV
jgi:hypothetical protein